MPTLTLLTAAIDDVDRASYDSASISPTVGVPIFAFVGTWKTASVGAVTVTSPSGGVTWTKSIDLTTTTDHRTLWVGIPSAATAGVVRMAMGATNEGCAWTIFTLGSDIATTGTVVQQNSSNVANGLTPSLALGSAITGGNATIACFEPYLNPFSANQPNVMTPRAAWTEISDQGTQDYGQQGVQWKAAGEQTASATFTAGTTTDVNFVLVAEIKVNSGATSATGTAAGTSTAAAVGLALKIAVGTAAGIGAAAGVGAATASSVGTAAGVGAASGVGRSTAVATGTAAGIGVASGVSSGSLYPITAHASGRYFVLSDGTPFPVLGRTAWFLASLPRVATHDYIDFLDDCVSKGFNAVEFHAPGHDTRGNNEPRDGNNNLPFNTKLGGGAYTGVGDTADFTTPNSAYWTFVDTLLADCESRGLLVLFFGAYVGFPSSGQGWMVDMAANGGTRMSTYGAFLAARYQHQRNLIWMLGGDQGTFTGGDATAESNYIAGVKSVTKSAEIYSAEWTSEQANDVATYGAENNTHPAYSFEGRADTVGRAAYALTPAQPAFLLEEPYDEEGPDGNSVNSNATQPVRRFPWLGWLSTIGGYVAGNGFVWPFNSGWETHLNTVGAQDLARLNAFIKSIRWWELVPNGLGSIGTLVTAGGGTLGSSNGGALGTYVAAAANPNGSLLVAYVSPGHSGTVTIDMTKMAATSDARWFDPTDASYTVIGSFANTGTHAFTLPTANSAGDHDFVLVLEVPPAVATGTAAGTSTATGVGRATAAAVGTAAGVGAASGVGRATAVATGTAAGTSTANAVTGSASIGTAAGTSTATGVGASVASSTGSSAGVATAAAVGAAQAAATGTAAGLATATGVGRATAAASGTAAGLATAAAVGRSTATATGTAAGTSTAVALSGSSAVGTAAGTSSALAVGASLAVATGTAAGHSTALAVPVGAVSPPIVATITAFGGGSKTSASSPAGRFSSRTK